MAVKAKKLRNVPCRPLSVFLFFVSGIRFWFDDAVS